ncbi:unnamed protein product [Brassica napus]|uniref:(rape) hypothetical protein n=1 Tax=Brassica napus TaxID=3708 RepID=A0A816IVQ2_BRANA|nr:unnamed protein product [Brassica napus]
MAAYFLNPYYFYKIPHYPNDEKFEPGILTCLIFYDRNWTSFEGIHTKKRNILDVNRLNSLVYVHFNARLFDKQKKIREGNVDVILDNDGNEDAVGDWLVGRVEELDNDVNFVLTTQAPRIRELYDDNFESEEEDMMDMEFEPDVYQEDPVFRDSQIA